VVLVAERSAFNLTGRIRHNWACDQCGEEFATSISVLPVSGLIAGAVMAGDLGRAGPDVQ
jgi:hypothetical protein